MEIPPRVIDRILTKATFDPVTKCLVSHYSLASNGYAQVGWHEGGKRRMTTCHVAIWIHFNGPVPDDMTVDHRCHNKSCVNITHYRLLTNLENARRQNGRDWPLGFCANGHDDGTSWYQPKTGGKGYCRECRAIIRRRRRAAGKKS